jgi:hypothetical protein
MPGATYDPMRGVGLKGQAIANVGSQVGNVISSIPELLKQDKEYKRAEAAYQYDRDQNNDIYNTLKGLVKDPESIPAPGPEEGRDSYLEKVGSAIAPLVRSGELSPDSLSGIGANQIEAVQEASTARGIVDRYSNDPMMQSALEGPQASATMLGDNVDMNDSDVQGAIAEGSGLIDVTTPEPSPYDEMARLTAESTRGILDSVKRGEISSVAAQKMIDQGMNQLSGLELKKIELEIEKVKENQKRIDKEKSDAAGMIADNAGKRKIINKTTGETDLDPMGIHKNPENYSLGNRLTPQTTTHRNISSGGSKKLPTSKLASEYNAAITKLQNPNNPMLDGKIQRQLQRNVETLGLASGIQNKAGGAAAMSDAAAKTEAVEIQTVKTVLSEISEEVINNADSLAGQIDDSYIEAYLTRLTPQWKDFVIEALQKGETVSGLLSNINKEIERYGQLATISEEVAE